VTDGFELVGIRVVGCLLVVGLAVSSPPEIWIEGAVEGRTDGLIVVANDGDVLGELEDGENDGWELNGDLVTPGATGKNVGDRVGILLGPKVGDFVGERFGVGCSVG